MNGVTPGQAALADAWDAQALKCDEAAQLPGLAKAAVLEQSTFAAQLRDCARQLRAAIAAQQPQPAPGIPLRSDIETVAMLRADLDDAEAQLAKWPKCPAGCSCRFGYEGDSDRNECGCDGPCNGGEQPAPELAAAMGETRGALESAIREVIGGPCRTVGPCRFCDAHTAEIMQLADTYAGMEGK